jgi:hypothetical protein
MSTLDAPPAYKAATSSPASSGVTNNDNPSDKTQNQKANPSIVNTFTRYKAVAGWGTVLLLLVPGVSTQEYQEASWAATLVIRCDVSRLMREGLFWTPDNIIPEEGHLFCPVHRKWLAKGLCHGRSWILADKSNGENPRWVGRLEVSAHLYEMLQAFRPENLSMENVSLVYAQNGNGQMVYNYLRRWPENDYNYIYDNKPLQGWWPWPKEGGTPTTVRGAGTRSWEDTLAFTRASSPLDLPATFDRTGAIIYPRAPRQQPASHQQGSNRPSHRKSSRCVVM